MTWHEIRRHFPGQWLVVEVIEAHSDGNERILDRIGVIDTFSDGSSVMKGYRELHRKYPERELLFVHTDREMLDVTQRKWVGIRIGMPTSLKTTAYEAQAWS